MKITHPKTRAITAPKFLIGALALAFFGGAANRERVQAQPVAGNAELDAPKPARARRKKAVPAPVATRLETLDVRASKEKYAGGEAVWLDVSLLNKAAKPAEFLMLGPKLEFKIKREGKIVGLTRKGQEDSQGDKVGYRSVAVGGKFGYRVLLSRVFDLSRAGNYVVSCSKYLKNENRDSGAELVGPRIVAPDVKFAVSDADIETENR